ncbi:hypothetical protein K9M79_08550 [Candidatus Woesearchaeota archaeon]|nr:hypothetical protein [Candidatus Woesearchaeota archaeon]
MDQSKFFEALFDTKILKVLRLFYNNKEKRFYLREISKLAEVSLTSTFRIINRLTELQIIRQLNISRFKLYKLDSNEMVDMLEPIIKEEQSVTVKFIELVKDTPGIHRIIQHGKESDSKSNVLVIGEGIPADEIKKMAAVIKDNYNFNITYLTLTEEQYNQMVAMGLYSGEKKILYQISRQK